MEVVSDRQRVLAMTAFLKYVQNINFTGFVFGSLVYREEITWEWSFRRLVHVADLTLCILE